MISFRCHYYCAMAVVMLCLVSSAAAARDVLMVEEQLLLDDETSPPYPPPPPPPPPQEEQPPTDSSSSPAGGAKPGDDARLQDLKEGVRFKIRNKYGDEVFGTCMKIAYTGVLVEAFNQPRMESGPCNEANIWELKSVSATGEAVDAILVDSETDQCAKLRSFALPELVIPGPQDDDCLVWTFTEDKPYQFTIASKAASGCLNLLNTATVRYPCVMVPFLLELV